MVSSYKSRLSYENPAVNSFNALKRRSILNDDNVFGPSALNRWASSLRSSSLWHLLSILPFWTCSWTVLWCRLFKDGNLILSFVAFARGFWSFYHEKMSHFDNPPRRITSVAPRTDGQTNRQTESPLLSPPFVGPPAVRLSRLWYSYWKHFPCASVTNFYSFPSISRIWFIFPTA